MNSPTLLREDSALKNFKVKKKSEINCDLETFFFKRELYE